MQTTDTLMMVRPVKFRFNEQTAVNNYYQQQIEGLTSDQINQRATQEFDGFVEKLRNHGVDVVVVDDTLEPDTPDSIFPNNWISFHQNAGIGLYPMYAENRRLERRKDLIDQMAVDFEVQAVHDLSVYEKKDLFLEGTGSMVLDRSNKIAYAALSLRTNEEVLDAFCSTFDYQKVTFVANQTVEGKRLPIYHTNVMMCVADQYAILCTDSIDDPEEKKAVLASLRNTEHEVITISEEQKHHFAGNMLQVNNKDGDRFLVMSQAAKDSLNQEQVNKIVQYNPIISSSLATIEALGGGSARCMMAEVFLPKK